MPMSEPSSLKIPHCEPLYRTPTGGTGDSRHGHGEIPPGVRFGMTNSRSFLEDRPLRVCVVALEVGDHLDAAGRVVVEVGPLAGRDDYQVGLGLAALEFDV